MKQLVRNSLVFLAAVCSAGKGFGQVTFDRLLNSAREPQNWLTNGGSYDGHRFSPLDQINPRNAGSLVPKWVYQTGAPSDGSNGPTGGSRRRPVTCTGGTLCREARGRG